LAIILMAGCLGTVAALPPPKSQEDWLVGKTGRKKPAAPATLSDPVDAKFIQLHPVTRDGITFHRSSNRTRAVVLIHGFHIRPFSNADAAKAFFHSWQQRGAAIVETLADIADVYSFAYSQNVNIEEIAAIPAFAENIRRLRAMNYLEIVLVGHSAGGLIARQFVEDYPAAGVTKVVQVCAPNLGTKMAKLDPAVPKNQKLFLHSLTNEGRADCLKRRAGKTIPLRVQFACLVADGAGQGDFLVSCESQWPPDLQDQGIPAFVSRTNHFSVMRSHGDALRLGDLVREFQPRLTPLQVEGVRRELKLKLKVDRGALIP
jgi:pimeloyl-ACP methyl ester carboxylesterase